MGLFTARPWVFQLTTLKAVSPRMLKGKGVVLGPRLPATFFADLVKLLLNKLIVKANGDALSMFPRKPRICGGGDMDLGNGTPVNEDQTFRPPGKELLARQEFAHSRSEVLGEDLASDHGAVRAWVEVVLDLGSIRSINQKLLIVSWAQPQRQQELGGPSTRGTEQASELDLKLGGKLVAIEDKGVRADIRIFKKGVKSCLGPLLGDILVCQSREEDEGRVGGPPKPVLGVNRSLFLKICRC